MQKQPNQISLADGLAQGAPRFLSEIEDVLDFSLLEKELSGICNSCAG